MHLTPVPERSPRCLRRFLAVAALAVGSVLALGACGGDDSGPGNLLETAGQAAGADVSFDPESGDVSAGVGDADIAIGNDLGRPDWLESEFQLPEGLDVTMAINDRSSGERTIRGELSGVDPEAVMAQQAAMLQTAGYERLGDSGFFVQDGRRPIEVSIGEGGGLVGYSLSHSLEDEQTLRDVYAPFEGAGTMVATIGGTTFTFDGACKLRSSSGSFDASDGTASLTIEPREGEQDYILGNFAAPTAESFRSLSVLQIDDSGNYPTIELRTDGFSFEGHLFDFDSPDPTPAIIDVTCPG